MLVALLALAFSKPNLAEHVLVVANDRSATSRALASYYMAKRGIPAANLVLVSTDTQEETSLDNFNRTILRPVEAAVRKPGRTIDYIVTTKGLPIRISEGKMGVEANLMLIGRPMEQLKSLTEDEFRRVTSPYYQKTDTFSHAKYNLYLVTRLDGYTLADAKSLVDNSVNAKANRAPFVFDNVAAFKPDNGWKPMDDAIADGAKALTARGFGAILDNQYQFRGGSAAMAGYVSWGSNDPTFDLTKYRQLRFLPGAIAETFVSTSARTFDYTTGGQSLIADLIAQGVTGVKGYVYEPYLVAMADPRILFDRYTKGYNLAESYFMASRLLKWRDLVIGDPLCAPYAK